jgi:hypothetical protein
MENFWSERVERGLRTRSRAVGFESNWCDLSQNVFRENPAGRVVGAQKEVRKTRSFRFHWDSAVAARLFSKASPIHPQSARTLTRALRSARKRLSVGAQS